MLKTILLGSLLLAGNHVLAQQSSAGKDFPILHCLAKKGTHEILAMIDANMVTQALSATVMISVNDILTDGADFGPVLKVKRSDGATMYTTPVASKNTFSLLVRPDMTKPADLSFKLENKKEVSLKIMCRSKY